jgi:hypothetical protein
MLLRVAIQSDQAELAASIATHLVQQSGFAADWTTMLVVMVAFARVGNLATVQDILESLAEAGKLPTESEKAVPFHNVCRALVETTDPAVLLEHMENWFEKYGILAIGPSMFDRILHKLVYKSPSIDCFNAVARLLRLDHRQARPVGIRPHTMLQVFRGLVTAESRFTSSAFELFQLVHTSNPELVSKELCVMLQNMATQDARWRDLNELKWKSRLFNSGFGNPEARIIVPFKLNLRWQLLQDASACAKPIENTRFAWHDPDTGTEPATDGGFRMRLRSEPGDTTLSVESTKVQMELMLLNKRPRKATELFHSLLDRGARPTERILSLATQARLDGDDVAGALRLHELAQERGWACGESRYAVLEHVLRRDADLGGGGGAALWRRLDAWLALPDVAAGHKRALVALAALRYLRSPLAQGRLALERLDAFCRSDVAARAPPGAEVYKAYLAAYANVFDWAGIDWAVARLAALPEPLGADVLLLAARLRREMCKELLVLTAGRGRAGGVARRKFRPVNARAREYMRGNTATAPTAAAAAVDDKGQQQQPPQQPDAVRGAWEMWRQREGALAAATAPDTRARHARRAERLVRALLMHGDGEGPVIRLVGKQPLAGWKRSWATRLRRVGAERRRRQRERACDGRGAVESVAG